VFYGHNVTLYRKGILFFFQGDVVIVDTPGIRDHGQEEVSGMMMDYIPNAIAFVFVLNVQSFGSLQNYQVLYEHSIMHIFENIENILIAHFTLSFIYFMKNSSSDVKIIFLSVNQ
jgi:translation elongation factor EF-1alpha